MDAPSLEELNLLHSTVCQAVSDSKRMLIVYALWERPRNVTSLAADLGMPQPTVSRHLRVLRQGALVSADRQGSSVVYSLLDDRLIDCVNIMRQIMVDTLERQAQFI